METWKDIAGFEGYYQVSNLGRVKSLPHVVSVHVDGKTPFQYRTKESILKRKRTRGGYGSVILSKEGVTSTKRIARLVAAAFIPNPNNLPQINHKDCDVNNDNVDNLEWCDAKYNCNYADHSKKLSAAMKKRFEDPVERQKMIELHKRIRQNPQWHIRQREAQMRNKNCKRIAQYTLDGEFVREYISANEATRETGILSQNIGQVCLGRMNSAGGYKWIRL